MHVKARQAGLIIFDPEGLTAALQSWSAMLALHQDHLPKKVTGQDILLSPVIFPATEGLGLYHRGPIPHSLKLRILVRKIRRNKRWA